MRATISNRNVEGLDRALGALIGLVATNQDAPVSKEMKAPNLTDLRNAPR